jgi:hypothetical protein
VIALDDLTPSERESVLAIDQHDVTGFCAIINGPDLVSARRVIEGMHARIGKEIPLFADYIARREGRLPKKDETGTTFPPCRISVRRDARRTVRRPHPRLARMAIR